MRTLSQRLVNEFPLRSRRLGHDYWHQGRVKIEDGEEDEVLARVRGSQTYFVSMQWEEPYLLVQCDCPAFDREGECKHLWALILEVEAREYLTAAQRAPKLVMMELDAAPFGNVGFGQRRRAEPQAAKPRLPEWRRQLGELAGPQPAWQPQPLAWPADRRIVYTIDPGASMSAGALAVKLGSQDRKRNGDWSAVHSLAMPRGALEQLPPADAAILAALVGARQSTYAYPGWSRYDALPASVELNQPLARWVLPQIVATGRCWVQRGPEAPAVPPLAWDDGAAWDFVVEVLRASPEGWMVRGALRRGQEPPEQMDVRAPVLIVTDGFVFTAERVAEMVPIRALAALQFFRRAEPLLVPDAQADALLTSLLASPNLPALMLPEELRVGETRMVPVPRLAVRSAPPSPARAPQPGWGKPRPRWDDAGRLLAKLAFEYGAALVPAHSPEAGRFDPDTRSYWRRDLEVERAAAGRLPELGFRFCPPDGADSPSWELAPAILPHAARALVAAGWKVEAEGKLIRRPGAFQLAVSSGVDWFDLHGTVEYGDIQAPLPALLAALSRGEAMVVLADGGYGMLPEEWLRRFSGLAGLGTVENGHLRFRPSQAGLLDALLAAQPAAVCDEVFARVRRELQSFDGIAAVDQPAGMAGHLRDYQREGLGWLLFLRRFGFGGCLADDMGVGKTAQALALLETRRAARAAGEAAGPSLIVAPRSLIFNWKEEAARFVPALRVLDYTGSGRLHDFSGWDAVLTTYGTLRREILRLQEVEFDLVILDEAQAIKNAATASAKAARLLHARQRLALSGTPVENHIGELWSLFEFLNPGMLGSSNAFAQFAATNESAREKGAAGPSTQQRQQLARALRPFILRRTKEQVVRELPSKTEQTLLCEMKPPQRRLYNELRDHYRQSLLARVDSVGMGKAKILVLEALLRLRQAACHPGLIDPQRGDEPSAKLETLFEQLREVLAAGHKALVFSQFTSFLRILRARLDADGLAYEYLDGRTRDRQAKVERFQSDPGCTLFLISLKAGGLGLNLTAAEYVFLLDPWWNPAVEAQAVDRAHRIGQTRPVFAYRLIASDSIEEKVLALQATKRDLAADLIRGGAGVLRQLRREDLEMLLE